MRYATELILHNWGPFKGMHRLVLGPTVYAVVAQHESDVERSNWIGKTWFLSAILFALTGKKPESCKTEDGWITNGESEGSVELTTDDGTNIKRSRKRGRSTQLVASIAGSKAQKQAVAQGNLYDAMGLNADDLLATSFIQQKQIARLITADPSVRTGIVNGWVELGMLERAEDWLRKQHNALVDEERALQLGEEPEGSLDELRAQLAELEATLEALVDERDTLQGDVTAAAEWQNHEANADDFAETRRVGQILKKDCDGYEASDMHALEQEVSETAGHKSRALDREHELKELVHGDWDGKCPLTCEDCPVEADVRAVGASMEVELGEAEIVLDEADKAAQGARDAFSSAQDAQIQNQIHAARLVQLRARAQELLPSVDYIEEHGPAPDEDERKAQLGLLNTEAQKVYVQRAAIQSCIAAHEKHAQAAQAAAQRREELEVVIRTHREAMAVVGRRGAQREVAELALAKVQRGANTLLQQSGIDLTVQVAWARESARELATHCDSCGSAHPKSQKVKTCGICGAVRGPKLVEKLDIQPSDRSGAADDICGLAFQLAASSWLRNKRSASWSSACIDEPFGALDVANSRALGTHLHTLIRGNYAFDQGFLVAHDAQAMESLPARIQIYGSADGAAVEVIE